jgi:hypothetical protein
MASPGADYPAQLRFVGGMSQHQFDNITHPLLLRLQQSTSAFGVECLVDWFVEQGPAQETAGQQHAWPVGGFADAMRRLAGSCDEQDTVAVVGFRFWMARPSDSELRDAGGPFAGLLDRLYRDQRLAGFTVRSPAWEQTLAREMAVLQRQLETRARAANIYASLQAWQAAQDDALRRLATLAEALEASRATRHRVAVLSQQIRHFEALNQRLDWDFEEAPPFLESPGDQQPGQQDGATAPECGICLQLIPGAQYRCAVCDDGRYLFCSSCVNDRMTCFGGEHLLLPESVQDGTVMYGSPRVDSAEEVEEDETKLAEEAAAAADYDMMDSERHF